MTLCMDSQCRRPLKVINAVRMSEYDSMEVLHCVDGCGREYAHSDQVVLMRDPFKTTRAAAAARRRRSRAKRVKQ